MRFFTSLVTATILTMILYFGVLGYIELFEHISEEGSYYLLRFLILGLYVAPIFIAVLTVIFYATFEQWNIKKLLFISLASYWLTLFLYWLSGLYLYSAFFNQSVSRDSSSLLHEFSYLIQSHMNICTPVFIILGYLILKKAPAWLHLNGGLLGVVSGYALSYGLVILFRWVNNSLTSFFYLDTFEIGILVVGTFVGIVAGFIVGNKSFSKSESVAKE